MTDHSDPFRSIRRIQRIIEQFSPKLPVYCAMPAHLVKSAFPDQRAITALEAFSARTSVTSLFKTLDTVYPGLVRAEAYSLPGDISRFIGRFSAATGKMANAISQQQRFLSTLDLSADLLRSTWALFPDETDEIGEAIEATEEIRDLVADEGDKLSVQSFSEEAAEIAVGEGAGKAVLEWLWDMVRALDAVETKSPTLHGLLLALLILILDVVLTPVITDLVNSDADDADFSSLDNLVQHVCLISPAETRYVTAKNSPVRAAPDGKAAVVSKLPEKYRVTVLETSGNWVRIEYLVSSEGDFEICKDGWIRARRVKKGQPQ